MPSRLLQFVIAALLVTMAAPAARGDGCTTTVGYRVMLIRGRTTAVWYPTAGQPAEYSYTPKFSSLVAHDAPPSLACGKLAPLVVFSHGELGCGIQSVFLTEELARNGYVVAAPDHADAAICRTAPLPPGGEPRAQPPQPNFLDPAAWNDTSRWDRRMDIEAVIDGLLADAEFGKVIDRYHVGLAGHSLGGYTVLGLAGGWPGREDGRVRAVLALSPYVTPFLAKNTLENVRVPLMYQGGTLDVGVTPFLKGPRGAFRAANRPVYYVELRDAGASCVGQLRPGDHHGRVPRTRAQRAADSGVRGCVL